MQLTLSEQHPAVHSAIVRMLQAADRLPQNLQDLFTAEFMDSKSKDEICDQFKLTELEYDRLHTEMLRNLRAAAA